MKISVCIPTYSMQGKGVPLFKRNLDSLAKQNFKDFEVVVTDNSDGDEIKDLCAKYTGIVICYIKNPIKGMAQNSNAAIKNARGELIKVLYQDDYLYNENSLQEIVENFKGEWMVTGCVHTKDGINVYGESFPKYTDSIHLGANTIGSPSVLTIKNESPLLFDEKLSWLLDCDLYKRYYIKYGAPTILNKVNIVIGLGDHQTTNVMRERLKEKENEYLMRKYNEKNIALRMFIRRLKMHFRHARRIIKQK